jgi:hypothetical protein
MSNLLDPVLGRRVVLLAVLAVDICDLQTSVEMVERISDV